MLQNRDPFESAQTADDIELTLMREIAEAVKERQPHRINETENASLRALTRIENAQTRKDNTQ